MDINNKPGSALIKIKKLLENAKGKNLFADIKDPVKWQRNSRKEWDHDFDSNK